MRTTTAVLLLLGACLASQAVGAQGVGRDPLAATLTALRGEAGLPPLPDAHAFTEGARTVSGATAGPVAVTGGPLTIDGTVEGDVVTVGGDIVLRPGAVIRGHVIAIGGTVLGADAASVEGEVRSVTGTLVPGAIVPARTSLADRVAVVLGVGLIAVILAVGVLVFAGDRLNVVADVVESQFGSALWTGVLAQLAFVPVLVLLVVALVATILGILLVPFAVVAYIAAAAGLVVLGLLAVARLVGGALTREATPPTRGSALRALVVGIAALLALWFVAVLTSLAPAVYTAVRLAAFAATWAGATVGLGAALLSRAGSRRTVRETLAAVAAPASWQTPTPVGGVVAARRPKATTGAGTVALLVALAAPGVAQAQWQVLSVSRAARDTLPVDVRVRYGAGRIAITPAARGTLYAVRLRYDVDRVAAVHRFDAAARSLVVGTATRAGRSAFSGRDEGGQLDLAVGPTTPLRLEVEAGAVEGTVELGGLTLDHATVATGAADLRVRVSAPLTRPARELRFEVGAAALTAEALGNAGAADVHVTLGAGNASLDFGGTWPTPQTVLHVRAALGELTLTVPREVGVHVEMSRFGADLSGSGLIKRDGAWVSDNWDTAAKRLRVRASTALAGLKVTRGS
jgi:hypothetical protein